MTPNKHLIVASLGTLALLGAGCGAAPETPAPAPSAPAPSAETQNPPATSTPAAADEAPAVRAAEPPAAPSDAKAITDGAYVASANSTVTWEGRKPLINGYMDKGTLAIKEGTATVKDGKVAEGNIVFDMTTIKPTAMTKTGAEGMLEKHLKSADFFDVEKYPTATLKVTSVEPAMNAASSSFRYVVKGDLTMKEKTNPVEFPATVYMGKDGKLHAAAKLDLNRSKWDVRFGSDTFFDNLANNVIDDYFTLSFDIAGEMKK